MFFGFLTMWANSRFYSYSWLTAVFFFVQVAPSRFRRQYIFRTSCGGSYMTWYSPTILGGSTQRNAAWLKSALLKMQGKPIRMLPTSRMSSSRCILSCYWQRSIQYRFVTWHTILVSQHLRWPSVSNQGSKDFHFYAYKLLATSGPELH